MEYLALFLTEQLDVIGTKKFKPIDEFMNYKKGTFKIDVSAYMYKNKETYIYGYIYPTDERLLIDIKIEPIIKGNKEYQIVSPRLVLIQEKIEHGDLHLLVAEQIIGQLARAFLAIVKNNWVLIILAVGCGVAVGYIACTVINPHTVTTILNNSTLGNTTAINPTPTIPIA
jgi:hypothetical protein